MNLARQNSRDEWQLPMPQERTNKSQLASYFECKEQVPVPPGEPDENLWPMSMC